MTSPKKKTVNQELNKHASKQKIQHKNTANFTKVNKHCRTELFQFYQILISCKNLRNIRTYM